MGFSKQEYRSGVPLLSRIQYTVCAQLISLERMNKWLDYQFIFSIADLDLFFLISTCLCSTTLASKLKLLIKKTVSISLGQSIQILVRKGFSLIENSDLQYTLFFQGSFGFTAEEGKKHLLLEINKFGDFKIWNVLFYLLGSYSKQEQALLCLNNLFAQWNPHPTINIAGSLRV